VNDYLLAFVPTIVLDAQHAALLVIDLQYASASRTHGLGARLRERHREEEAAYRFDRIERFVVPNTLRLLEGFRSRSLHVIYLTVGSEVPDFRDLPLHMRSFAEWVDNTRGRREHEILDEVRPHSGELVLNKLTTGGFNSSSLDLCLRTLSAGARV
jgi:biuret amidohydrolase